MNYAGFWKRFMAVLLDFAILLLPAIFLGWALPYAGGIILAVLYFPLFESSSLQATPGKYWMGLKVLNEDGKPLNFYRALARFALKYVSSALLFGGYLIQLFTEKRQTLHDLITNAVVVDHAFQGSPDWINVWLKQARYIFRVDELNPATASASEMQTTQASRDESFQPTATSTSADTTNPIQGTGSNPAVEAIEKLYELYKAGVLTEDEFQAKKSELLKKV